MHLTKLPDLGFLLEAKEREEFEKFKKELKESKKLEKENRKEMEIEWLRAIARKKKIIGENIESIKKENEEINLTYRCSGCGVVRVQGVLVVELKIIEMVQSDDSDRISREYLCLPTKIRICYCRICGEDLGRFPHLLKAKFHLPKFLAELEEKYGKECWKGPHSPGLSPL